MTPISIKNRVFKINTLQVEAIAIKHFKIYFSKAEEKANEIKNIRRNRRS